ncbi:MAG: ABC transporter permease subunit [Planctomycetia bacterium]|nr:ABC transporter permease subunit [Planctomycetia bacterium]
MPPFVLLRHELTRLAQAPRTALLRTLVLAGVVALAASQVPWGQPVHRLQAAFAGFFPLFFWCGMLLAVFVVPAMVAADIPVERERGTLELLLACPQTERDILVGKLGSQAAQAFVLLGTPLPLMFASVALGGIRPERAIAVAVGIALSALMSTAIAVRVSVTASSSSRAAIRALVLNGSCVVGSLMAVAWMSSLGPPGLALLAGVAATALGLVVRCSLEDGRLNLPAVLALLGTVWMAFLCSSCLSSLIFEVPPLVAPSPESLAVLSPWAVYGRAALDVRPPSPGVLGGAWTLHFLVVALVARNLASQQVGTLLSSRTRAPREDGGRPLAARTGGSKEAPRKLPPGDAAASPPRPGTVLARPGRELPMLWEPRLPIEGNPVTWRESLRIGDDENAHVRYWVAAVSLLFLAPAFQVGVQHRALWGGSHVGILGEVALLAVMLALTSASTIARELERDTLPLLISTGYPPILIVLGKLRVAFLKVWPVLAVAGFHSGLLILDCGLRGAVAVAGIAATLFSVAGLSVGASWFSRRQRVALPVALVLPFAVWALPLALGRVLPGVRGAFEGSDPLSILLPLVSGRDIASLGITQATVFVLVTALTAVVPVALVGRGIERRARR